ncbi:unnamed protein product [Linum trigynum]|uniref:Uncharacterized protein n=1 Tax=Linum trigynum TaxID=586398 RepID=A0AAV2FZM1_9ROSI
MRRATVDDEPLIPIPRDQDVEVAKKGDKPKIGNACARTYKGKKGKDDSVVEAEDEPQPNKRPQREIRPSNLVTSPFTAGTKIDTVVAPKKKKKN